MNQIDYQKLAEIFTDTLHHKNVAEIIRTHSTNKLDVRNEALDGLQLQNSRVALDIGCGFGFFTRALKNRLLPDSSILGIDTCVKNKTSFLESCKMAGLQGKFSGSDEKMIMTLASDSVDLVICSYALYFFPAIIPEISRVLKPSGNFVVITHSGNHLNEIISFINDTFDILGMRKTRPFPYQTLLDSFNNRNGYRQLSPWFGDVEKKEYRNSLRFEPGDFEALEKYFRFKQSHFIHDYDDSENIVFTKIMNRLAGYLHAGNPFVFTKDDTIFICKEPLYS